MTQTVKGQKGTPQAQKQYRPGQRQKERLQRQVRRRRQRLLITASLLGVVLIVLAGVGVWQYPRIIALFQQHPKSCTVAAPGTNFYASTPSAGPSAPPTVQAAMGQFANGLQCIDLKVGNGPAARIGDVLSIEYTSWLAGNNQKFDSSYDHHGQPQQILLGAKQVIKGLEEGLVGAKAGTVRRLIIPPNLGYGVRGEARHIPSDATLIYDAVVLSVNGCSVATGNNIYNSPSPSRSTSVVGPVLPSGPLAPPPIATAPGTLFDGLKCIDLKLGTGAPARDGSVLAVQYTGWSANVKKFDSSYDRGGTPLSVTIGKGQLIKGVEGGLIGIKVGGTRRLIIPPALAYGAQGRPPVIPPNATLTFDITVVSMK